MHIYEIAEKSLQQHFEDNTTQHHGHNLMRLLTKCQTINHIDQE
jgi:hypothetical protein